MYLFEFYFCTADLTNIRTGVINKWSLCVKAVGTGTSVVRVPPMISSRRAWTMVTRGHIQARNLDVTSSCDHVFFFVFFYVVSSGISGCAAKEFSGTAVPVYLGIIYF